MTVLGFVGCTKAKRDHPCVAIEMYKPSTLFRKLCDHIETENPVDALFILSAKYGLLEPLDPIDPYDETLNDKPVAELRAWAWDVIRDLEEFITDHQLEDEPVTLRFYCGERYRRFIIPTMEVRYPHWRIEIPLKGLGIGEQLHALS